LFVNRIDEFERGRIEPIVSYLAFGAWRSAINVFKTYFEC